MNKVFLIGIILSFGHSLFSQITVEEGVYPFTQVTEWQGRGCLFMGDEPTGIKKREKNITLFNRDGGGEEDWNSSIFPATDHPHLIMSAASKYLYFVDDLSAYQASKIRYNQVNISGSIVHPSLNLPGILRKYRIHRTGDLQLRDIVNTPKALVLYFQLPKKDEGIMENIFITVTHHDNRVYSIKGPTSSLDKMKEGEEYPFYFAGADSTTICFGRYNKNHAVKTVEFTLFTPKAKPQIGRTFHLPKGEYITSAIYSMGYNGAYYLRQENKEPFYSKGRGLYILGHFYFAVHEGSSHSLKIFGRNEKNDFVQINKEESSEDKMKDTKLSFLRLDNKIIIKSKIRKQNSSCLLGINGVEELPSEKVHLKTLRNNPSRLKIKTKTDKFVQFINGESYATSPLNKNSSGKIIFKRLK